MYIIVKYEYTDILATHFRHLIMLIQLNIREYHEFLKVY